MVFAVDTGGPPADVLLSWAKLLTKTWSTCLADSDSEMSHVHNDSAIY